MKTYQKWYVVLIICIGCLFNITSAQEPTPAFISDFNACGDASNDLITAKTYILEDINELRLNRNLFPFFPNQILCQVAQEHAILLGSRSSVDLFSQPKDKRPVGDTFTGLEDWIKTTAYTPYPNNIYGVALYVFISQVDGPTSVFSQIGGEALLISNRYREIGLGYVYKEELGVYIYTLVVGSQPNTLIPVSVDPTVRYKQTRKFLSRSIVLAIPDEQFQPGGSSNQIGNVLYINVSQVPLQPNETPFSTTCTLTPENRHPYSNFVEYMVTGSLGSNTIWVRMCDGIGRMIVMSTDVSILGEVAPSLPVNPEATLAAIGATQTALAQMAEPASVSSEIPVASTTPQGSVTDSPSLTPSETSDGASWLQLDWTEAYVLVTNISAQKIDAGELEGLSLVSNSSSFELTNAINQTINSEARRFDLPVNNCIFISETGYNPPSNNELLKASQNACNKVFVWYHNAPTPWHDTGGFTVRNSDGVLAVCAQNNAGIITGSCTIRKP